MKRLTVKRKDGRWAIRNDDEAPLMRQMEKIPIAIDRLAAYEDTGLEPAAADQLKKIAEIFHCDVNDQKQLKALLDTLRELDKAEKDGRLVMLPCKIGETLYSMNCGEIREFTVAGFELYGSGVDVVEQIRLMREHRLLGKTAFLTREEAEAALKRMEETET